jgi:hypothetical protein
MEYLGSICGVATLKLGGKLNVGCRACPPFNNAVKWPDGQIVELTQQDFGFCALSAVYEGSFTRAGAKQVVLSMESPFMVGSAFDQNAVVVEFDGKRWRVIAYSLSTKSSDSLLFRRDDGTDVLVGHDSFGAFFDGAVSWFYAIDFTKPRKDRWACFGKVAFNAFDVICAMFSDPTEMIPFSDPNVIHFAVKDTKLDDLDGDGTPELVATVGYVSQPPNKAVQDKVRLGCQGRDHLPLSSFLPRKKEHALAFRYEGGKFVPTLATRKLLEVWKVAAPERWYENMHCGSD